MELSKEAGAAAKKLLLYLENLFRTHPTADALHVTADKQFFLDKSQADNYAMRLPDKQVSTVTRSDFEAVQAGTQTAAATEAGSADITAVNATEPGEADEIGPAEDAAPAKADELIENGKSRSTEEDEVNINDDPSLFAEKRNQKPNKEIK
jgi:hypothetical protein